MENQIEELQHVVDAILIDNAVLKAEIKAVRGTLSNHYKTHQSAEEYEVMKRQISTVYKALAIENVKGLSGHVFHESSRIKSLFELEAYL